MATLTWQVQTPAGTLTVKGRKILVTASGALMVLDDRNLSTHIYNDWGQCIQVKDAGDDD